MAADHSWKNSDSDSLRVIHEKILTARHELGLDFADRIHAQRSHDFFQRWEKTLTRVKSISVDIFDTAIIRSVLGPDDVFLFIKEIAPFSRLVLGGEQIYELRKQAEHEARATLRKKIGSVEVTLAEIYSVFAAKADCDPALVADFISAEQTVELALGHAHPVIQSLIQQAAKLNKNLLFVSDTFHSRNFLHLLLTQAGYAVTPDRIFPSCEYREGKYSGLLLREACRKLGFNPGEVAHLGDSAESDEKGAHVAGMVGLLHPFAINSGNVHRHRSFGTRRIETIVRGTARMASSLRHEKQFWFSLGCEIFGPLLTGYMRWLIARWRRDKIEQVFFLLRDGLILRQIYALFQAVDSALPRSALLYSSRRALAVPALGCDQTRNIDALLVSGNPRPASEFLSRIGLDPALFPDAFKQAGFKSSDEIVDHRGDTGRVLQLIRHESVLPALSRRALAERKLLVRYLEQENVTADRPTALVDIGWNNTVQKALLAVLDQEKIGHRLYAYYLGTLGDAPDFRLRDYRYDSYLCHNGEPVALGEPIASCRVLLEIVCTSFEGSLRCFGKSEGKIEAVLDPVDMSPHQQEILRAIHDGILESARAFISNRFTCALPEIPPEIAAGNLLRLLLHPTPNEARQIGQLEHGDGAGSLTRKRLAAFDHDRLSPDDLLNSYRNAYWKEGLLGLDTAQAMALRQLVASKS